MECLRAQSGSLMLDIAQNGALLMRTDELVCMQLATREPKPIEIKPKETKTKASADKGTESKSKTEAKKKKSAAPKKAA